MNEAFYVHIELLKRFTRSENINSSRKLSLPSSIYTFMSSVHLKLARLSEVRDCLYYTSFRQNNTMFLLYYYYAEK